MFDYDSLTNRVTPDGVSIISYAGNELSAATRRKEMTLDPFYFKIKGHQL